MTLTLAEGLVDTLTTYFAANLAAKITDVNARYFDGIALVNPVATYVSEKSLRTIQDYPALFIVSDEQAFRPMSVTGGKDKPTVYIGIVAQDPAQNVETLARRVFRYRMAIIELLLAANALSGWAIATDEEWQSGTFVDPVDTGSSDFLGTAIVRVRASAWED